MTPEEKLRKELLEMLKKAFTGKLSNEDKIRIETLEFFKKLNVFHENDKGQIPMFCAFVDLKGTVSFIYFNELAEKEMKSILTEILKNLDNGERVTMRY